ncbi:MAG: hypothetical protein N2Z74_09840, partial [Syntrophales bacterium]|nr:hypothetical protein [Syntrophales bacterium]
MKAPVKLFIVGFLFVYGISPMGNVLGRAAAETDRQRHLLVITAQPYVTSWFTSLNDAFVAGLKERIPHPPRISYEYIDTRIYEDAEFLRLFKELLVKKYRHLQIDLVVGVMPSSSALLLEHGDTLFPGIPKLYLLPHRNHRDKITAQANAGIVASTADIPGTIARIRSLFPETQRLYVVSGAGPDDTDYLDQARIAVVQASWPDEVVYLRGLTPAELLTVFAKTDKPSAVLMLTYLRDRQGTPLTTVQVMNAIAPVAPWPIFGFYDTILGLGIVGGRLTSAEAYGRAAAEAAFHMLAGAADRGTVKVEAQIKDMYDDRQLQRWGIARDLLPPGSIVRYRQPSFWEQYKEEVTVIALIVIVQSLLIVALVVNLKRRRAAQEALAAKERDLRRANRALTTIAQCN